MLEIILSTSDGVEKPRRTFKGKSLLDICSDYTVIDIETTGLDPRFDEIIEVAAIKVRGNEVLEVFQSLSKPTAPVSDFISSLTGITNEMLEGAPNLSDALRDFVSFTQGDLLVGHNVHFDINFLYDNILFQTARPLSNDFIDTLRMSRRLYKGLDNHKLSTVAEFLGISNEQEHRGLSDCLTTYQCYEAMKRFAEDRQIPLYSASGQCQVKANEIVCTATDFDASHPLYGRICVFTGVLERMQRRAAMQLVVNLGGVCEDRVTQRTNYLILGNNDYCKTIVDGKSHKQKRAEEYMLRGYDLKILSEDVFYDMVEE